MKFPNLLLNLLFYFFTFCRRPWFLDGYAKVSTWFWQWYSNLLTRPDPARGKFTITRPDPTRGDPQHPYEAIIITWSCSANGSLQPHYSVVDVYFDSCCGFSWNLISFLHIVSLTCSMCPLNVAGHILSAKKTQHVEATAFVQKKIDKWMFRHCYSKARFLAPYTYIGLQLGFAKRIVELS